MTTRIAHLRRGPSLVVSKDLTLIEVSPCKSPAALQLGEIEVDSSGKYEQNRHEPGSSG